MNREDKKKLRNLIESIMRGLASGGTQDYVNYVKANDGRLAEFSSVLAEIALKEEIRNIMRNRRMPQHRDIPAYPSVDEPTGEFDDEGKPITRKVYKSMGLLFDTKDVASVNQVVDSYAKRARSNARIANNVTLAAREEIRGYQRELPFQDLADEEGDGVQAG